MKKYCIVIPAYQPSSNLIELIASLDDEKIHQIVVVNDGSDKSCNKIFESIKNLPKVVLLEHAYNLGKGQALKTAFNYICLDKETELFGVITADADGQHLPKDILKCATALENNPSKLVLGCRVFDKDVPLRSRFGNILTASLVNLMVVGGGKLTDTQTGLRGIPLSFLKDILKISSTGYEYEMKMLMLATRELKIVEIPIETVYLENNKSSHFNPLIDSFLIYFTLFRFSINSILTSFIDFIVFSIVIFFSNSLVFAIAGARLVAGIFNFTVNKYVVFKTQGKILKEFIKYTLLVIFLGICSYYGVKLLVLAGANVYLSKILVESVIFLSSFFIQRFFIFETMSTYKQDSTDWNSYYADRNNNLSPTRKITAKIITTIIPQHKYDLITEFGGGDSCFYQFFRKKFSDCKYRIVDSAKVGVDKFLSKNNGDNIDAICDDLFNTSFEEDSDLVYSIGLIEHFDRDLTKKCIEKHFQSAKKGGIVLISYPTPTLLYRITRKLSEILHLWRFFDERPLKFNEVNETASQFGELISRKLNWAICLTQEVLVYRKR